MSIKQAISRALAWFRRNPGARADALILAASAARDRAAEHDQRGKHEAARRLRRRATAMERRAQQLRAR